MTLHEFIILMILPIGTSGYNEIQYKIYSGYIAKLQIHQHIWIPWFNGDLMDILSLTCVSSSSLTHALYLSECVSQIERLTLYLY